MARPIKTGLDYFPLVCDIFTNKKIKALRRAHGQIGILTYINLLCRIYSNGYYYRFDDLEDLSMDIAEEIASEQISRVATRVTETINYLVKRGTLDEALFEQGIISGEAMQEQYVQAAYKAKRKINLDVHCLVDVGDCIRKIKVSSEITAVNSEEIGDSSELSTQSKSKSKKKNSLSLSFTRERGKNKNVFLSDEEYDDICSIIPKADEYIDYFSDKLISKGYTYPRHYEAILKWWNTDRDTDLGASLGYDRIFGKVFDEYIREKELQI